MHFIYFAQTSNCVLTNEGGRGSVVFATDHSTVLLYGCILSGGTSGVTAVGSTVLASYTSVSELCD